jgi:hypothetical protein
MAMVAEARAMSITRKIPESRVQEEQKTRKRVRERMKDGYPK